MDRGGGLHTAEGAALAATQSSRPGGELRRAVHLDGGVLGEGADGKVVGAKWRATGQRCAVKLLKDPATAEREASMCARAAHPNVVELLAWCIENGLP